MKRSEELISILTKFSQSGWDLIALPAKAWLSGDSNTDELIKAIEQADSECGSCGCEFDPLYKRALELKFDLKR
ncbi:MAG TPA: hypothetical protein PK629_04475 [Oscillospiraceae bacterium]|nr:hypothetical protein [Oscillospiraceae bacterium]HPF55664.1 hypothetical protein [Clostridiales bacterium]HPK35128.1 hypothetical protein [Oscillospiraceae bacterium]HPR74931.1 hypothetical protein [Oscillospiraceae bacterium]